MMDKNYIRKVNKLIRDKRPSFSSGKYCEVFQSGDLLEIGFLYGQCRNDSSGSCLMCDYGRANNEGSHQAYISEMNEILNKHREGINFLLLCSNGSILDEKQISTELLSEILKAAQSCNIPRIIIETHYRDVNADRLNLIKHFVHKPIIIEMGLETINPKYQNALFMKGIEIDLYEKTICLIHDYGYDVELNLMFGLPFLSAQEQLEDAKRSIDWAICHQCTPIIFPINIKPYTILRYAYDNGLYQPISLWLLIILLDSLNEEELSNILIAWYGNRDDSYIGDIPTIFPQTCSECRNKLIAFGRAFLDAHLYDERKALIAELLSNTTCDCYQNVKKQLELSGDNFDTKYDQFYQQVKKDFNNIICEAASK